MPEPIQRHDEQTNPNPFGLTSARLAMIGAIVLAFFWVMYVRQASQTTLTGQRAYEIQQETERIKRENMQLEIDIAALTAPARIAERARALGLRPTLPSQVQYMVIKDFPTENPQPLTSWQTLPVARSTTWLEAVRVNLGLSPRPPTLTGP
ncbi:MAG: cell division protein FtsL [Chloroflexi bacterium]|nr:cell division protein FtsL [Chloroflexota bacterium]